MKQDNLLHEVQVTRAWLAITRGREHTALRLNDVNQKIKPDMEIFFPTNEGEDHFYVEYDSGSVSHAKQKKRWELYRSVDENQHELLVITSSQARMHELIRHAGAVAHLALFSVLDQLVKDPSGDVWMDCTGARQRL